MDKYFCSESSNIPNSSDLKQHWVTSWLNPFLKVLMSVYEVVVRGVLFVFIASWAYVTYYNILKLILNVRPQKGFYKEKHV